MEAQKTQVSFPLSLCSYGYGLPVSRAHPLARMALVHRSSTSSAQKEGYTEQNVKLGRPLSPSLSILARHPDVVWVLSFSHRATGAFLTAGVSAAAITYLASGSSFPEAIKSLEGVASYPILWNSCKFVMAFPLVYHMVNGIRHLTWDTGRAFDIPLIRKAGYAVVTVAVLTTLGLLWYTPAK